jgi:hypothetical protein
MPAAARVLGLLGGSVAAVIIAWIVLGDWQGARAHYRSEELARKHQWQPALDQASLATQGRLGVDDRLMAQAAVTAVAHDACDYWFRQLADVVARAQEAGEITSQAREVAVSDAARFEPFFAACMSAGQGPPKDGRRGGLLYYMPGYPYVAGRLAEVLLMKEQKDHIEQQLGLRRQVHSYLADARELLRREYERDPFNDEAALRLLQLTPPETPLADRLNLLRVPLRAGPVPPAFRPALAALMRDPGFEAVMNEWMALAHAVAKSPSGPWADPYAPETLRLAALHDEWRWSELQGPVSDAQTLNQANEAVALAGQAALLAGNAADLLSTIQSRFPTAAACARADQARYELMAAPRAPEGAIATYRLALVEWPAFGSREQGSNLKEGLSLYLLAAGQEQKARENLQAVYPAANARTVDGRLAMHLEHLGQMFINLPARFRPAVFESTIRRLLQLNPDSALGQLMAAQLALEQGRDREALDCLEQVGRIGGPERLAQAVQFLLRRFPDNGALRIFAERLNASQPASRPDEEADQPAPLQDS